MQHTLVVIAPLSARALPPFPVSSTALVRSLHPCFLRGMLLRSAKVVDALLGDGRRRRVALLAAEVALLDPVVVRAVLAAADELHKLLVVGDHDQLEVGLLPAALDDLVDGLGKRLDVGAVEVGRRLVEGEDAAVDAKGLGEREARGGVCGRRLEVRAVTCT